MKGMPSLLKRTELSHYVACKKRCMDCALYDICGEPCYSTAQAAEMMESVKVGDAEDDQSPILGLISGD